VGNLAEALHKSKLWRRKLAAPPARRFLPDVAYVSQIGDRLDIVRYWPNMKHN
jgi:hypothetical protein